jgi:hypothetical protein
MDAHSQDTGKDSLSGCGTGPGCGQRPDAGPPLSGQAAVSAPDREVPAPHGAAAGSSSPGHGQAAPDPRIAAVRRFAAMASRRAV